MIAAEADDELDHDQVQLWVVTVRRAVEDQRADVLDLLDVAALAEGAADVGGVGADEEDDERNLRPGRKRRRAHGDAEGEEDQEEAKVALERGAMGPELGSLLAPVLVDERRDAHEAHRDRGEEKGRADDRADGHLLRALGAADDRDDRDQRLGHRRSDRRQERAHGALAQCRAGAPSTRWRS